MKIIFKFSWLVLLLVAEVSTLGQTTKKTNEQPAPIRSVFIIPASPHDGRDPFFPESTRPYEAAITSHVQQVINLVVKGISGTAGDRLVIINNHTFGVGDESDVLTSGGRVHVRCLEITANGVVIEANNQRRELNFSSK